MCVHVCGCVKSVQGHIMPSDIDTREGVVKNTRLPKRLTYTGTRGAHALRTRGAHALLMQAQEGLMPLWSHWHVKGADDHKLRQDSTPESSLQSLPTPPPSPTTHLRYIPLVAMTSGTSESGLTMVRALACGWLR